MGSPTQRRGRGGGAAGTFGGSSTTRDAEALRLHEDEGKTLDEIVALDLGWQTKSGVSRAIARAYARGQGAKVEEIRTRLTAVLTMQFDSFVAAFVAARDSGNLDEMLRLSPEIVRTANAISKRNGTDAPTKTEVMVVDDWDAKIRALTEALGPAPDAGELVEP